jgi:hypothetical protein
MRRELRWKRIENGCWEVVSHKPMSNGYVLFRRGKLSTLAHRYVYEMSVGPIPTGLFLCHKCDNPLCVNPKHMFLGSQHDNMMDMVNKKRHAWGERSGRAILTDKKVIAIFKKFRKGTPKYPGNALELSKKYGVSITTIYAIHDGRSWKHLSLLPNGRYSSTTKRNSK